MSILCKLGFHKWHYHYLPFSTYRNCIRCGARQELNVEWDDVSEETWKNDFRFMIPLRRF